MTTPKEAGAKLALLSRQQEQLVTEVAEARKVVKRLVERLLVGQRPGAAAMATDAEAMLGQLEKIMRAPGDAVEACRRLRDSTDAMHRAAGRLEEAQRRAKETRSVRHTGEWIGDEWVAPPSPAQFTRDALHRLEQLRRKDGER